MATVTDNISGQAAAVRDAALDYLARGWAPIPIPLRSKNPNRPGWEQERLTDADIHREFSGAPRNIGVLLGEPSGWLIDIDLDHETTVRLAPSYLPPTDAVFGRLSKPRSHWLYRVTGPIKTKKFKSPSSGMLVELRVNGLQTVFPPSIHEKGERIEWDEEGEPALIAPDVLLKAVSELASAARAELGDIEKPTRYSQDDRRDDHRAKDCLAAMLRMNMVDHNDGSSRLYAAACRAVEYDLTEYDAMSTIRAYAMASPFPRQWSDDEILQRIKQAEGNVERGKSLLKSGGATDGQRRSNPIIVASAGEFNLTDLGNAQRFAARHGDKVRYCHQWSKWLVWDTKRWAIDQTGAVERLGKDTVRTMLAEAAKEPDDNRRRALTRHALASESATKIAAMLRLAQSEPGIPVLPADLDTDHWLLNVRNGTINLKTMELQEHRQSDMITKLAPVEFDMDATCPTWERVIRDITRQRERLVRYIQRVCGMCLTGSVLEQILNIFYGSGCNGKSTLLEMLLALLGEDYAIKAPHDLLMTKRGEHPTERADLLGKRLVVCVETDGGRRLAESLVKELTGNDTIRARRMREDFWQFRPTHKIILATNHRPEIRGTDTGIWRRLRLVPFDVSFLGQEDRDLPNKLQAELPGILNWCLAGCIEWQDHGLGEPEEVTKATDQYRQEQDILAEFLDAQCLVQPGLRVRAADIYGRYKNYCEESGEPVVTQRRFGASLTERGFERATNNGVWYLGLGLRID